jgi:hypothetical protein
MDPNLLGSEDPDLGETRWRCEKKRKQRQNFFCFRAKCSFSEGASDYFLSVTWAHFK